MMMAKPAVHKPEKPNRRADIAKDMARLKGMSESQLQADDRRGASSPLGRKKMEKGTKI
jgi:hypothetical protein